MPFNSISLCIRETLLGRLLRIYYIMQKHISFIKKRRKQMTFIVLACTRYFTLH